MSDKPYNKLRDIRIGLEVFERLGGLNAGAQHEVLYAGPKDGVDVPDEDRAVLEAAGWFWDDDADSWAIFT